jgi:hypothetical protein
MKARIIIGILPKSCRITSIERVEIFHVVAQRFIRGFGLAGLAAILSLGLAGKVHATYFHSELQGIILIEVGTTFWMRDNITTLTKGSITCSDA